MSIPDYQSIMSPILELASDGNEHLFREAVETLAGRFGLTDAERQQPLPSKTQPLFHNRVGWARTYLVKAGLLESARRGYFRIAQRGRDVLQSPPPKLNTAYLRQHFKEFQDFQRPQNVGDGADEAPSALS